MKWLTCALASMLVGALVWRSCAGPASDNPDQTRSTQAAWRDAPHPPSIAQASRTPVAAPELQDRHAALRFNDGPRAPGETEKQYRARMEVLAGLEAFRQQADIGEERYQRMLAAIYDHQYNWARFQEANPYEEGPSLKERDDLVRDLSRTLQERLMAGGTIGESMIWHETCRRCLIRIMFGSGMVRLDEGAP